MKVNGMCPVCYLKQIFTPKKRVASYEVKKLYDNGAALTPPMGWSSWNIFRTQINEDVIYETAKAMKEKGLVDAGYNYLNLDDNWHSSLRDENGNLQGDLTRFPSGITSLVSQINKLGIKVGIYSSDGEFTCEDLPASLGHEWQDAYTFARWGIEYLKYDYCHNIKITVQAPLVESICIAPAGEREEKIYPCTEAVCEGAAKLMPDGKVSEHLTVTMDKAFVGKHISGLDKALGKATFKNIYAENDGEYILTVVVRKKGNYKKFLLAKVNDDDYYCFDIPPQKEWNYTARFQQKITLKKGMNKIELFNPVKNRADSTRIQYINMGNQLKKASAAVAKEQGEEEKPITFSICEWGRNRPYMWGAEAGNLWRTSADIQRYWINIMINYKKSIDLYKYASPGHWNDPDMLEVGNGEFTAAENQAHFSLWCMMASPLLLGNDLRTVDDNVLSVITNKNLIAIDQDELGKPAKRIVKGKVDVLARPLSGGRTAVCFFNKTKSEKTAELKLSALENDGYAAFSRKASMTATEQWTGEKVQLGDVLRAAVSPHGVKVYIID